MGAEGAFERKDVPSYMESCLKSTEILNLVTLKRFFDFYCSFCFEYGKCSLTIQGGKTPQETENKYIYTLINVQLLQQKSQPSIQQKQYQYA